MDFRLFLDADRLAAISQRIGFALWQLQELEDISAHYLVLVLRANRGMGVVPGQALLDAALSKTFGSTVHRLSQAGQLSPELEVQVKNLLAERNWLVHDSLASSRRAVRLDGACKDLISRIDEISVQALALMKEFGALVEIFVKKHGITSEIIEALTAQTLKEWNSGDAP